MVRARVLVGVLVPVGVVAVSVLTGVAPVHSAPAVATPGVGDCFDLSDSRLDMGTPDGAAAAGAVAYWPDVDAVPCSQPHTFQVTETGVVPQDVNAFEFAAGQCGPLDVWNAVGVNRSPAGIVDDPLRVEARSFAVRQASPAYVCGAVAVRLNGREPATAVTLDSRIERLGRAERAALRYCSDVTEGRSPTAAPVTVPCTMRPRWQVTQWVMWTAFYDAYPGRGVLRERARALCGAGAVVTVPTATEWNEGLPRTWCYREYP